MCHHVAWNCISALLSFTYRTKPKLYRGFVERPLATSEKRIPINKSATVRNLDKIGTQIFKLLRRL